MHRERGYILLMRLKKSKQSGYLQHKAGQLHTAVHTSVYSYYPIIYRSIPQLERECSVNYCISLWKMLNTKFSNSVANKFSNSFANKFSNSVANLHFVVQVSFQYFSTGTWRIASGRKCGHWPVESGQESQPTMVTTAGSLVGTCTALQGRRCTSEPVERAARSLQVLV